MPSTDFQVPGLSVLNMLVVANNKVVIGSNTANVAFEVISTDAIKLPSGNTGQRPTGINGYLRYNNQTNVLEGYLGGAWTNVLSGSVTANMAGPASSTNNGIAVYSGTTGSLLRSTSVTINANNKLMSIGSNSSTSGFKITPGTDPSAPADGDMWITSTDLFVRVNGATKQYISTTGGTITNNGIDISDTGWSSAAINATVAGDSSTFSFLNVINASNTNGAAFMKFVRQGQSTWRFGVDKTDTFRIFKEGTSNTYTFWHDGNLTPSDYMPLSGGTFTGTVTFGANNKAALANNGDIYAVRANGTFGAILFNSAGTRFISSDATLYYFNGSPGAGIYVQGNGLFTGTVQESYSDARLKTEITPIKYALDIVTKLNGVSYYPNEKALEINAVQKEDMSLKHYGLLTQDVEKVIPELVTTAPFTKTADYDGDKYYTIAYTRLIPFLIEAIKELDKKVNERNIQ